MRKFFKLLFVFVTFAGIPVGLYLLGSVTGFFSRALGTPANLIVDTGSSFVAMDSWKSLAQGGEELGNSLGPVTAQLAALRPQYVRIDHIYDFYHVVSGTSGNLAFNWSELDAIIAEIQKSGAKPFLSLSYMPIVISKSNEVDEPANWSDWELLVQRTIEHVSRDLGISEAYYEVWNEPDLFGAYKTYGPKNYLDLYAHSAAGAARAQGAKPFKFGGPATTALYQGWFDGLLKFATANSLRLDFFSWHHYSKALDDYEKDVLNVRSWIAAYPAYANIEFIVSELGPNSENDKVYDERFSAIHAIATAAVFDGQVSKGFNFEIKDGPGPDQMWGRWGMLTHEKYGAPVEKDRYKSIQFMNQMIGTGVNVTGQGSWVKAFARNNNGVIQTLVVNYDPSGSHDEVFPMTFVNLPFRNFNFKRQDFLGLEKNLPVATTSASWRTEQLMLPNTAAIFTLTPQ